MGNGVVGGGGNLKRGGHGKRGMCVRMIEASSSAARAGFFTFCRFSLFIIIGPQPYDLALRFVLYYGGRLVLRFYLSSLSSSVLRSFYLQFSVDLFLQFSSVTITCRRGGGRRVAAGLAGNGGMGRG